MQENIIIEFTEEELKLNKCIVRSRIYTAQNEIKHYEKVIYQLKNADYLSKTEKDFKKPENITIEQAENCIKESQKDLDNAWKVLDKLTGKKGQLY